MKRLLGGILVLAVLAFVALGAASYWFGVQTEREYKAMMQRSADWQNFKLTGEEYTRGVFSSEAKATLELANPPPLPSPDDSGEEKPFPSKVMLVHQISHGPVPFGMLPHAVGIMRPALAVIETKASIDPRFKELFKELKLPENRLPTMDMFTVLKWGGEGDTHWTIHPFKGELGEAEKVAVDFSGLKLRIEFTPGFRRFKGSLSMDGLEAAAPEEWDLTLKRMSGTFDQVEGMSGIYLGDMTYTLELIGFKHRDPAKARKDFSLKGFSVKTQAQEAGNDLSSSATFSLDQVDTETGSFHKAILDEEMMRYSNRMLQGIQMAVDPELPGLLAAGLHEGSFLSLGSMDTYRRDNYLTKIFNKWGIAQAGDAQKTDLAHKVQRVLESRIAAYQLPERSTAQKKLLQPNLPAQCQY